MYTCYRCGSPQSKSELREGHKHKSLSKESSKQLKRCKNCSCRVFYYKGDE